MNHYQWLESAFCRHPLSGNKCFRTLSVLKLRSSYSGAAFSGPRTCAGTTVQMAATILGITSALALTTRAGFSKACVH